MIGEDKHQPGIELGRLGVGKIAARFNKREIGCVGIGELRRR